MARGASQNTALTEVQDFIEKTGFHPALGMLQDGTTGVLFASPAWRATCSKRPILIFLLKFPPWLLPGHGALFAVYHR